MSEQGWFEREAKLYLNLMIRLVKFLNVSFLVLIESVIIIHSSASIVFKFPS